ncbi:hypothetical protein [Amycolatopsis keratiniphila]|uniref:hypothetical protein n=1 Tax=Amycolatopsis keratiniphila TaxID=129921 RepID=UPI0011808B8C|nr:hypothetical protein [Amycolatopsis keratiniphila]
MKPDRVVCGHDVASGGRPVDRGQPAAPGHPAGIDLGDMTLPLSSAAEVLLREPDAELVELRVCSVPGGS